MGFPLLFTLHKRERFYFTELLALSVVLTHHRSLSVCIYLYTYQVGYCKNYHYKMLCMMLDTTLLTQLQQKMSDKKTPMDQAAKAKIMSNEYKSNDGKATDWSKRAQSAADKNYPQHQPATERVMSKEYQSNDGKATDWSRRAQSAADNNYPQHQPGHRSDGGSGV